MDKSFYDDHRGSKCPPRLFSKDARKIKEAIDTVAEKAFQGFILHEGNYDTDPHVKDFLGFKMQNKILKDEKGKKIN